MSSGVSRKNIPFLSTPSARRATLASCMLFVAVLDFYPRPPRGGRLAMVDKIYHAVVISIHALREEGDQKAWYTPRGQTSFLSTPSARRATRSQ